MKKTTLQQLFAWALVAFAIYLLVNHPHSPAVFVRTYSGHK